MDDEVDVWFVVIIGTSVVDTNFVDSDGSDKPFIGTSDSYLDDLLFVGGGIEVVTFCSAKEAIF
jgi:hypothetical protein